MSGIRQKRPQILALLAAIGAATAMGLYLYNDPNSEAPFNQGASQDSGPVVGDIQTVEGTVLVRYPKTTRMEPARSGPYRAETVLQTQAASAVTVEFQPGPTIRLLENSRLVAEVDPTRDGVIQATLLAGEFTVLNPGTSEHFTIMQNGIALNYKDANMVRTVPLIQIGEGAETQATADSAADIAEKLEAEKESELSTVPSTDIKSATGTPEPSLSPTATPASAVTENQSGLIQSTLTNDDIRSQVRSQAGSFQKCYVAMVNRMSESAGNADKGALPKGEIRVSFKILATGKVEEPAILKSPFQDVTFGRCVTEALGRMRFRSFQGPTIPVGEFPILLE